MSGSPCRFFGWLGTLTRGLRASWGSSTQGRLSSVSKAVPLTNAYQAVQRATPLLEEQFAYLRMMEEVLAEVDGQLGQAWREREKVLDDYYAMVRGLLQVLDHCETISETIPSLQPIQTGLENILRSQRVEPIRVVEGDAFCAETHCCEETEPSDGQAPGTILRVLDRGYQQQFADGSTVIIRPTLVVVSEPRPSCKELSE